MRLTYDSESDGFVEEATVIWCIVTKDTDSGEVLQFPPNKIKEALEHLNKATEIICHNQISHDFGLFHKLYPDFVFNPDLLIMDTMILSQLLYPDRKGGHSLGQYGEELGIAKPIHEDWSKFSPEMLHRCTEDVNINHKVYDKLIEEAYEDIEGIPYSEVFADCL